MLTVGNAANEIGKAIDCLADCPSENKNGRGVVIAAGGTRLLVNAWVNVRMLRDVGCDLPVQIWHLGRSEYSPGFARLIEPFDVTFVDANEYLKTYPHARLRGWELKPYMIAHSPFEEVLCLDADNVAVRDPTYLFDDSRYRDVGTVFWPDYGRLAPDRDAWGVFGVEYRDEPEVESGQVLVDKSHPGVWKCLELANWMMQNSDNFFFRFVHGDKEIFHLAWRRLNQRYAMPTRGIDSLPGVMCQHDFDGERVFQHRNMRKWTFGVNEETPGFIHEGRCFELVKELRESWSPCTSEPPREEDIAAIRRLDGKRFVYFRVGHDRREVCLSADGGFLDGGAGRERFWTIRKKNGMKTMIVTGDDGKTTMVLTPHAIGEYEYWTGAWQVHERMPIMLIPIN